jgi:hypothetical protein
MRDNMKSVPAPIVKMDGRNLYYTFIAGARKVIEHQVELNRINVFPVNDGDTGTNLASTIRSVIEYLHPHRSFKVTADRIAEATLVNARGNSGIIFAQFLYGLSLETGNYMYINLKQFAESIQRSVRYVYEAVANPVEGTMLTVIKEWAEYIYNSWHRFTDFNHLLLSSYDTLSRSLQATKAKLKILASNGVVDAGAKGFVLFVEGIIEFIHSRNLKELFRLKAETFSFPRIEEVIAEKVDFRYCTEAIIRNSTETNASLKNLLARYGDSIVVAGSDRIKRLHVHTNSPAELFDELRHAGVLSFQKADDMIRQSEAVYKRKWNIALVTDSTCDLPGELIDRYQINMLPINISFGENNYLDKTTIQPKQFYKFLNESPEHPKTAQVNETAFTNLYSHLASHYDSIISIHLSDKLSGTFNNSLKAAKSISNEFNKPVTVLDSRSISGAMGLLITRVAQAIEAGLPHEQIVSLASGWINNTSLLVSVSTLKYLIKGGRLSAAKGFLARLLNITPVLRIDEAGRVVIHDRAFSQKSNMEKVIKHVKGDFTGKSIWNYIILHANNYEAANWFCEKMIAITGKEPLSVCNISPVIGVHVGVGAAAVAMLHD